MSRRARRLLELLPLPLRVLAADAGARLLGGLGYHLVRCTPHCPIPELPPAGARIWGEPREPPGLALDVPAQLAFLETVLLPWLREFRPLTEPTGRPDDYHLLNTYYGPGDAELLYGMIRHARPRRLLEVGAGYSTLVSAAACLANEREGHPVELVSVDPEPRLALRGPVAGLARIERRSVREVPLERFEALGAGDILFVDSSHAVKLGSDVNFLVLDVLPRLRPGVLVHFHDIFLPYEYPRRWLERGSYLTEQYLLEAFLSGNPAWEVLFAAHAVDRAARPRLEAAIPSLRLRATRPPGTTAEPAAFWLRRRA